MSFISNIEDKDLNPEKESIGGGLQPLIPTGLKLHCVVAGVTIKPEDNYNNECIVVEHHVLEKGNYEGFLVNHKLHVHHDDIKKRDKARTTLLSYDANANGDIKKAIAVGKDVLSNVNFLARSLNGTEIESEINLWEMPDENTGEIRTGNNIKSIFPLSDRDEQDKNIVEKAEEIEDDDIPF